MAKSLLNSMAVFLLCCNPYLTLMLQQRAGLLLLLLSVCRAGRREQNEIVLHRSLPGYTSCCHLPPPPFLFLFLVAVLTSVFWKFNCICILDSQS